jgi:hypothetical protein
MVCLFISHTMQVNYEAQYKIFIYNLQIEMIEKIKKLRSGFPERSILKGF